MPKTPIRTDTKAAEKALQAAMSLDRFTAPAVGIFDEPARCYRLNNQWAKIVMGWVEALARIRPWDGATDERFSAIQEILRFMIGGDCMVLDCGDVEDCLEVSGIILSLEFAAYSAYEAATEEWFEMFEDDYDGTPQSIEPTIPTTAPSSDPDEDEAFCYAINRAVSAYAAQKAARLSLTSSVGGLWQGALSAVQQVFGQFNNRLAYILGDELHGCTLSVQSAINALTDDDAIDTVSCHIYNCMKDSQFSQTNWDNCVTDAKNTLGANPGLIACLLDGDNTTRMFLSLTKQYQAGRDRVAGGETLPCVCDESWCYAQLWDTELHNWTIVTGSHEGGCPVEGNVGSNLSGGDEILDMNTSVNGFVTRLMVRIKGVGGAGGDFKIYADGEVIYDDILSNGDRTIYPHRNITTLRLYGRRGFHFGFEGVEIAGIDTDPMLSGAACPLGTCV